MKTRITPLAIALALAGVAALASTPAIAAGHGFAGSGHGFASAGRGGSGWHGAPLRGRGGFYRGGWGHRGYWPGVFWGGIGLGVGLGAVGYYNGYYNGYYAPYPYYGGYYNDDAPEVIVSPGYTAVEPAPALRSGQPVPQASRAAEPIFYPRNGQSAATTESDRRDCNRWATTQNGAMADASIFQRATLACMEGRGYTAK